jgi:uncharacterized phiE125 gp8 family phage protein
MTRIVVLDRDSNVLPNGLLSIVKSHLRVSSTFDDDYIKSAIARAIAWFETSTDTLVNPVELQWWPDSDSFNSETNLALIPETPVIDFTVADANNIDVSANYSLISMSTKGVGWYSLKGAFVSDMSMTFTSGYESVSDIPAGVLNVILLYTGHLYENREMLVAGNLNAVPGWLTHVIAPWWKPSV